MARDKVCVVIGAGDATGGAIARRFAREGYTAVVTRRTADKLKHLVAEITQEGGKVHPFGSDARDEEQVLKLFREIETEIGEIEVFVFNIGGNVRFDIRDTTARVYRKVWEMTAFAGLRRRQARGAGAGAIDGARTGAAEHPRRPCRDRRRHRHRMDQGQFPRALQCRPGRDRQSRRYRRSLLAVPPPEAFGLDVRDGPQAVEGDLVGRIGTRPAACR